METKKIMDVFIFAGFSLLILIALLGFLISGTTSARSKAWFMPRFRNWSVANVTAAAVAALLVVCVAASPDSVFHLNSTGNATGMAMWMTLLFSFYRFGLHDLLRMSREAAWRIHYVFGILTIAIASFHGVLVFHRLGPYKVFHRLLAVFGLVGLILMVLGVVPFLFLRYDRWKSLHFLSFVGLMFTIYHTVVAAFIHKTPVSIITAILDSAVVLAYVGQKIYTHLASKNAVVRRADVIVEPENTHIFLDLSITGFSFKPGQWGRLRIPSISAVAHPFTLIPGRKDANVSICMKVCGKFTSELAERCQCSKPPAMCLQGPYGCPCLPAKEESTRTVFVLGGVGVTPALSLAATELARGRKVAVFWAVRSEALLEYAAPFLEPCLDPQSCIRLRGKASGLGCGSLPLQARYGAESLRDWLASLSRSYASNGLATATIFVCGPDRMIQEVKEAREQVETLASWDLHLEEFHFLPQIRRDVGQRGSAKIIDPGTETDIAV